MAGTYHIQIEQGATYRRMFRVETPNGGITDLTDWIARAQGRLSFESEVLLFDLSTGAGLTIDGEAGTITMIITAEDTTDIKEKGVWDLEIESPDGEVIRLLQGLVTTSRNATR